MADNVTLNKASGTFSASTDDCGSDGQVQRIKLAYSADGVATHVGADSDGLDVDVTRCALPTGAATSAAQGTGNASLSSIDGKLPALGQALAAASLPVILPAATVTTLTPPAAITGFSTAAKQPALGTAGTASADVLTVQGIASMTALLVDGSAVTQPVSDAGGSLTVDGTVAATQSGTWNVTNVSGTVSLPTGAATAANQATANTTLDNLNTRLTAIDANTALLGGEVGLNGLVVDGSGVTQPVSLASVPSHNVTNAGTFAVQVSSMPALPAGTAAIGKLAANSGVDIGDVDVTSLPALAAGTNLIGKVSSGLDTATINNGTTALTPKFAAISTASSGNTTIVAAVTSKKIRVLNYRFQADADVSVKFRDNTAGVDLTGAMASGAKGGGGGSSFSPVGHFETASGNALSINLSGAVQVSGHLAYLEI